MKTEVEDTIFAIAAMLSFKRLYAHIPTGNIEISGCVTHVQWKTISGCETTVRNEFT